MSLQTPSVYITRSDIPAQAIEALRQKCNVEINPESQPVQRNVLLEKVVGKDALFCMLTDRIDADLLDAAGPSLKVIGTMSVGHDHIDLTECRKRNILVGNTPGVLTDATAELALALLLATSRRIVEASKEVTNGGWHKHAWGPLWLCGTSLSNSTVGIVGLGRIGSAIMEKLSSFKIKSFLYTSSSNTPKLEMEKKFGARLVEFEELLKEADFIIVSCTLNPSTENLFTEKTFMQMKPSAIFINTSRGGVVDQDALYKALTTGQITAAGLDVMTPEPLPVDHPLTKLPNCVLLPHISSSTIETRTNMAMMTVTNILAGLNGSPLVAPL